MIVAVDPSDPTPAYQQIRQQIARMVAAGTLQPGAQLPTIRQLALDLQLAKGTVARAYESLLRDGVVEAAGRRGTVVAPPAGVLAAEEVAEELLEVARALAVRARQLGADDQQVSAAVEAARRELG
ncbi:MAG: GntR family transcriptional regulator [Nitriliruptoraceae bacterium]|nr:GntR family transcriptional regulator [Nitriliruptoraceae bacterium]